MKETFLSATAFAWGQREIHTTEPLVSEPGAHEFEMDIGKLKRHKTPDIDQIPAELIKAGGRAIHPEIHKFINSIWNKEEFFKKKLCQIRDSDYNTICIFFSLPCMLLASLFD